MLTTTFEKSSSTADKNPCDCHSAGGAVPEPPQDVNVFSLLMGFSLSSSPVQGREMLLSFSKL